MRLSKALIDMEMADYSAVLDPAYTTLEFENMQVLAMGNGKSPPSSPLRSGGTSQGLQEDKSPEQPLKCSWGGLGHGGGVTCGAPSSSQRGFCFPRGEIEVVEQCCAQCRWDGALQPRHLGDGHTPGAGYNEKSPPDIQPRDRDWG